MFVLSILLSNSRHFRVNWPRFAVYAVMFIKFREVAVLIYVVTLNMLRCVACIAVYQITNTLI